MAFKRHAGFFAPYGAYGRLAARTCIGHNLCTSV